MKFKLFLVALIAMSIKCGDLDQALVPLPGAAQDDQILPDFPLPPQDEILPVDRAPEREYVVGYCAKCDLPIPSSQAYTICNIPGHDHIIHAYHELEMGDYGNRFQKSSYPLSDTDVKLQNWLKLAKLPGCGLLTEEAQAELLPRIRKRQPRLREDARRGLRAGSLVGPCLPMGVGLIVFLWFGI